MTEPVETEKEWLFAKAKEHYQQGAFTLSEHFASLWYQMATEAQRKRAPKWLRWKGRK